MKFLRPPKAVVAQRSRARHLAHKRKPKLEKPILARLFEKAGPDDVMVRAFELVAAMLKLDPIAARDYLEWLRQRMEEKQHSMEENHAETSTQETSRPQEVADPRDQDA